jgi:hypothetical protein
MLVVLAMAGLLVLLTGVVAAVLLALGTVLALIFAVSVWQATLVAAMAAAGTLWLTRDLLLLNPWPWEEEPPVDPSEDELQRPARRGKQRRR